MTILKHKTDGSKPVAQNWNGYNVYDGRDFQQDIRKLEAENIKLKAWMKTKKGAIKKHVKNEQELLEQLENVFWQACGETDNRIDTVGLSAYEDAARYLAKRGRVTDYNGRTGVMKE